MNPRRDMSWLVEMHQSGAFASLTMPAGRFFTPTEAFWALFDRPGWRDRKWVDAGAGSGELTEEALARGLDMMAVDPHPRDGQAACVHRLSALALPYNRHIWALICRPDHGHWCAELIDKVRFSESTAFYVGNECNLERDLDEHVASAVLVVAPVGLQGEGIWQIGPG